MSVAPLDVSEATMLLMLRGLDAPHIVEVHDWIVATLESYKRRLGEREKDVARLQEQVQVARAEKDGMKTEVWQVRQRFSELEKVIEGLREELRAAKGAK